MRKSLFTGIIEEVGKIALIERAGSSAKIKILADRVLDDVNLGDSIAVNGICLTVVDFGPRFFIADATPQTLKLTNLGDLKLGSAVNLERALSFNSRLGGHIVTGHIDGLCMLKDISVKDNSHVLTFSTQGLSDVSVVERGSVAINGISLTVASVDKDAFSVSIIPHSFQNTNLANAHVGDKFNLEFDLLGKYVQALLCKNTQGGEGAASFSELTSPSAKKDENSSGGLTMELLRSAGF